MQPRTKIEPAILRATIASGFGPIIEEPWPCDMLSAHAELIRLHNMRELRDGRTVENRFMAAEPRARRLADLLWEDFDFLSKGDPRLAIHAERYLFLEVAQPVPGAFNQTLEGTHIRLDIICMTSPLIHWINSAFSKIYVLTSADREAHCLPEHRDAMVGTAYSPTNLSAALFNDLEVLFDIKRLSLTFTPPHLASPYTYCQWVDSARRFILAHEIGHSFYDREAEPLDEVSMEMLTAGAMTPGTIRAVAEERWCDQFAMNAIFKCYDPNNPSHLDLIELANAIIAVFFLFNLMEVAEVARQSHGSKPIIHPPARLRLYPLRDFIKQQAVYKNSDWFRAILDVWWRKANQFRDSLAGIGRPLAADGWSLLEFREKLSPFGLRAYNALFQNTVWWANSFHDGDSEAFHADNANL